MLTCDFYFAATSMRQHIWRSSARSVGIIRTASQSVLVWTGYRYASAKETQSRRSRVLCRSRRVQTGQTLRKDSIFLLTTTRAKWIIFFVIVIVVVVVLVIPAGFRRTITTSTRGVNSSSSSSSNKATTAANCCKESIHVQCIPFVGNSVAFKTRLASAIA